MNKVFALLGMFLLLPMSLYAADVATVEQRLAEAEQLRAQEFSPSHYAEARKLFDESREREKAGQYERAGKLRNEALVYADKAVTTAQKVSENFPNLVESRDRMQMIGDEYLRADLVKRAEDDFGRVVASVEEDNLRKAQREAELAQQTIRAAQVVAARERFSRPITKAVADARQLKARNYAPQALNRALDHLKKVEAVIKDDPEAQGRAYGLSKDGEIAALKASRIAKFSASMNQDPAALEKWLGKIEPQMQELAALYEVQLDETKPTEKQLAVLKQAALEYQQNQARQLEETTKQLAEMEKKLGQYDSELAGMQDLRRKLQLKREAEAKIKRLTSLFDRGQVEILLTPDADVILRMKSLNFRSGSAAIPPDSYALLDNAVQSMAMFPGRAVRVEGHTDSVGENAYNQRLSERRAKAVEDYLKSRITSATSMISVGFGEEKPVANNETAQGRAKNRRIDIVLIAPK